MNNAKPAEPPYDDKQVDRGFASIELTGNNIKLRPTTSLDAERAYSFLTGEPDFTRFMLWEGPKSISELEATYGTRWPQEMADGTGYPLAIEENSAAGIIGCIHLRPGKYLGQFDFGYWLGKPYRRQGYMTEALGLICFFCFTQLSGEVIQGIAFAGNTASRRVMEKNGFKFEGALRREVLKNGRWTDLWHFSLLREEWQQECVKPVSVKIIPKA